MSDDKLIPAGSEQASTAADNESVLTRRGFLRAGASMGAGVSLASGLAGGAAALFGAAGTNYAWAQPNARIRVGVVGCGGRGSGAAGDCARASKAVQIVSIGDVFQDRVSGTRNKLKELGEQNAVTDERTFVGFDAYQKVIDSGVDLVILATPPGFRPLHLAAAVAAGKHVFMEKPVAVDPVGVRSVMESGRIADAKKLSIVTGTQRRHDLGYVETMKRIHDGAIGDIVGGQIYWNQGGLWSNERREGESDLSWQLRDWLYFVWLSGDHIVEQHVHNIDVMNWAMKGHPTKVMGMGGRQWRVEPKYGHIYDHFAIEYEFPNNVRWSGQCRQIDGTSSRVGENIIGTKGRSNGSGGIWGTSRWSYEGPKRNPYEQEHVNLIAAIQAGTPLNEAQRIAESTMTAIMARESAYTGKEITWDEIMKSNYDASPAPLDKLDWKMALPVPPVPMPGRTKLERKDFGA